MGNPSGEYSIKRQVGGRGWYASVRVELVEVGSAAAAVVELPERDAVWRNAVGFGIDHAMFLAGEKRHFRVVVSLHTMLVDSTPAVVAAATARAVLLALGRTDGPLPDVEPADLRVVFPQW